MIEKEYQLFWDYYLGIEKDLYSTVEYVEPVEENYDVYSQFDVLFKEICKNLGESLKKENIVEYKEIILRHYPKIQEVELQIIRGKVTIRPFENWENNDKLLWWSDYQKVKHYRSDNYRKANLRNAIYSVGALRVLELYIIRMNSENQIVLGNHDGPFFRSPYTMKLLFPSSNKDLPDFIE